MNDNEWLSRLLGLGAIVETPVALLLLIVPSPLVSLILGATLAGPGLFVARLAGGGLLALGICCWFARATPTARASLGVAVGFLAYNVVACVVLALAPHVPATRILPLVLSTLHGLLAAGVLGALIAGQRSAGTT